MKHQFLFGKRRVGGVALFNRERAVYANRGFVASAARPVLLREKAKIRQLLLRRAGPWRRSSSRPRPTSSPPSGQRPSNDVPGGGCEYGRRLQTRGACCGRSG